jgi:hypothetical protein
VDYGAAAWLAQLPGPKVAPDLAQPNHSFISRRLARGDDGEELVGALHFTEGIETALQEGMQRRQAGQVGRALP